MAELRNVISAEGMTDEQFLKHMQLSHGSNKGGSRNLWEYPHMRYEDTVLLDTLHQTHHKVESVLTCLAPIDHVHEEY